MALQSPPAAQHNNPALNSDHTHAHSPELSDQPDSCLLEMLEQEDWGTSDEDEGPHAREEQSNICTVLPEELLQRVFSFLSADDLLSCLKVCSTFHAVANEDVLWRRLYCARWGKPGRQQSELSWKAQYLLKDSEESQQLGSMPDSELYMLALQARRQQSLGRSLVDDPMRVPRCELQERLHAWRRTYAMNKSAQKPDLRGRGRDFYTWDRIGDYFCVRETGWVHLCDHNCRESIIDPAHDLLVCPYSARTVERMVSDSELQDHARSRTGPKGHDEGGLEEELGWGGFIGRAYERGYHCRDEKELTRSFFG